MFAVKKTFRKTEEVGAHILCREWRWLRGHVRQWGGGVDRKYRALGCLTVLAVIIVGDTQDNDEYKGSGCTSCRHYSWTEQATKKCLLRRFERGEIQLVAHSLMTNRKKSQVLVVICRRFAGWFCQTAIAWHLGRIIDACDSR